MSLLSTISAASIRGFQNPTVGNGPSLLFKLTSPALVTNAEFGFSVDATDDGSRIIIGQPGPGSSVHYAFIYVKSGSAWNLEAALSDAVVGSNFGNDVAISGDGNYAIVGANDLGKAYIYQRSGTIWSLVLTTPGTGSQLGTSVDINQDGTWAVIGAPTFSGIDPNAGAAYVYTRSGSIWSLQNSFLASPSRGNSRFGTSVRIDNAGDQLVFGYSATVTPERATFSYRTGATWSNPFTTSFNLPGQQLLNNQQVAISNDGSYAAYGGIAGNGVNVYTSSPPGYTHQALVGSGAVNDNGLSLNLAGTSMLIQSKYYTRSGSTWTLQQDYIVGPVNVITSDNVYKIFGQPTETVSGFTGAGAVYIFA